MSDKEKEIDLLKQLIELDGYFAQYFEADLENMIDNIEKDFPIEYDTEFYKEVEAEKENIKKLNEKHKQKLYSLFYTMLNVQASGVNDNSLKESVIREVGLHEVVRYKQQIGLEWDQEDKEHISNLLNITHT